MLKKIKLNLFKELSISFDDIKYKCYNYNAFNELIKKIKNQETIELDMDNTEYTNKKILSNEECVYVLT